VLVVLSPKFHSHEVGLPVDVSVNCTACPTAGEVGLKAKDAISVEDVATLMIWVTELDPELLPARSVTA
jgi:hypothetical protein